MKLLFASLVILLLLATCREGIIQVEENEIGTILVPEDSSNCKCP